MSHPLEVAVEGINSFLSSYPGTVSQRLAEYSRSASHVPRTLAQDATVYGYDDDDPLLGSDPCDWAYTTAASRPSSPTSSRPPSQTFSDDRPSTAHSQGTPPPPRLPTPLVLQAIEEQYPVLAPIAPRRTSPEPDAVEPPCELFRPGTCGWTFLSEEEAAWIKHVCEELRHHLPHICACCFCGGHRIFSSSSSGGSSLQPGAHRDNFHDRMEHIHGHLAVSEFTRSDMRPDEYVAEHLHTIGLVDDGMHRE